MRNSFLIVWLMFAISITASADVSAVDLTKIDRKIAHEPEYQGQPHYALLVFGPEGKHRSWLVIDGESVAYVDRNGNGDLTEPGERVELDIEATKKIKLSGSGAYLRMNVFPLGEIAGTRLDFRLWVRNPNFDASKDEFYRDYLREWDEKQWVNGTLMRTGRDGSRSPNPLLLTVHPEDAQVSRFDGPITATLKWNERQQLEPWPKQFVFDVHLGYRNLLAKDCDRAGFAMTRFTTSEVPESIQPIAKFEFSDGGSEGKSITREVRLDSRCCGNTFYATLTLPKEVRTGSAKVTVRVEDWIGLGTELAVFDVPINQEISRFSEAVYIMFRQPGIAITDAVNVLRKRGLDVFIEPERLRIAANGTRAYIVQLVRSDEVREVSTSLGEGADHAEQLMQCDARFEIQFANVEKSIQDQSVLTEIRSALQELTNGYAYQTWDKQLIAPH